MKMRLNFLALFAVLLILAVPAGADPLTGLTFCGENVPLNQPEVFENLDQDLLLLAEAKSRVWLTLRRSRYLPIIERQLKEASVPEDLKYLPMALTNLTPDFRSGSHRGLWRLTESEAAQFGLSINQNVDLRLDPQSATIAAAQRLKNLKNIYGTWALATAAYLDEPAVSQALAEAGGEKNFYKLYLSETLERNFSLILAGKVLYSHPETYGYQVNAWPILSSKRVQLEAEGNMKTLAGQYKIDYKTLRDMNPHILSDQVPVGTPLNIP